MNPNNPNDLDPKLKEAYERIMGGPAPQNPQQPNPQNPTPAQSQSIPQPQPAPQMQTEQVNELTPPVIPPTLPQDDITQSPISMGSTTFVNPNPTASEVTEGDSTVAPKKKGSFMPILVFVGGLVFFFVYAVIWSKVFGLF